MVEIIPPHIKDAWDRWNISGAVILSLTLQAILICFSPLRKRTPRKLLIMLVWTSYLLADWSANFAVGLISKNQGKGAKPDEPPQDKKLMALWAPFLLLHLGGPDTITAFALEDNALWLRHFFGLVFQALAGVYVVLQSLPNSLWLIIVLLFISGTIKYLERTTALYSASLDKFRDSMIQAPDPGPNYAKLMEEYIAKKESRLPTKIILIDEPDKDHRPKKLVHPKYASTRTSLTHLELAQYAYRFFNTFKGLVVNLIFSFRERDESLEIFANLEKADEALRILEIELGFLYDALFTKIAVLHTWFGTLSRFVASGSLIAAFVIFHYKPNKDRDFHNSDIVVTYTLFGVGIALDFISFILFLFSDWTCISFSSLKDDPDESRSWSDKMFDRLLGLREVRWKPQKCNETGEHKCSKLHEHDVLRTRFFLRRWCGNINVFNFITYATKGKVHRIHDARDSFRKYAWMIIVYLPEKLSFAVDKLFGSISKLINGVHKWISHQVNEFSRTYPFARKTIYPFYFGFISRIPHFIGSIFGLITELFDISDVVDRIKKGFYVHGEPLTKQLWEFMFNELRTKSKFGDSPENAKRISLARGEWTLRDNLPEGVDQEKLVRYVTNVDYDQSLLIWHIATELCYQQEEEITDKNDKRCDFYNQREYSKILSDYMMYLLVFEPSLMSEVGGIGKIRFRDTLAETDKFFHRRHIENSRSVKEASKTILEVRCDIEPMGVKGDRSKSVLFDASRLAKDLMLLEEKSDDVNKWEILSKVWVELLSYAACHCDATSHVEQLSRGGELINFVWLLMAHFGLTDQFQINKGDARAKLIIGK